MCVHHYIHQHVRCYMVSENWMCFLTCILINLKLNFIPKIVQDRHQYIWIWLICTEATVQQLKRIHLWKVSRVYSTGKKQWVYLQYWSTLSLESLVISFLYIYWVQASLSSFIPLLVCIKVTTVTTINQSWWRAKLIIVIEGSLTWDFLCRFFEVGTVYTRPCDGCTAYHRRDP